MLQRLFSYFPFLLILSLLAFLPQAWSQDATKPGNTSLQDSIQSLKERGIQEAREGNLEEARVTFLRELNLKQKQYPKNHPKIGHTYVNLGVAYKMQGKMNKALEYYDKADRIYSSSNSVGVRKTATNYQNMANIYTLQRDYEKARKYYQQALNLLRKDSTNNMDRMAMVYNNLGIMLKNKDKMQEAINNYKKSINLKKKINIELLPASYSNLSNVYFELNKIKKAETYINKAISLEIRNNGKNSHALGSYYINLGLLKLKNKEKAKAESYLISSLNIYKNTLGLIHPETSRCFENMGHLNALQGDTIKALGYYQKALGALSDSFSDTTIQANPEPDQVLSRVRLLSILKRKAGLLSSMQAHQTDKLQAALKTYNLALEVIRQLRTGYQSQESKLSLTANQRETYLNALQTARKLHRYTGKKQYLREAFRYAEASKAAVLYESMQSNQALKLGNIPDSLRKKENNLKKRIWTYEELIFEERKKQNPDEKRIDYWSDEMFSLQKEYEALVARFETEYPRYYSLKYNQEILSLPQVQDRMRSNEMLVEYVLGQDSLYAFRIEKQQAGLFTSPVDSTLPQDIMELRNFLSNRNFSNHGTKNFNEYQALAHGLHNKLVAPLDLTKGKKLTIIPDDILSYIPFEVLVTKKQSFSGIQYGELAYLMRDHQIGYSYSAKVLYNQTESKDKEGNKLAAFAPTYENVETVTEFESPTRQQYREKLYPLKGIKKEARRITEIIRGDIYSDYEATEKRFKETSAHYDILHLAMHTLVNDQNPMYSKMAFTQQGNTEEDGFLNTYEIYSMNLDSRMAVLSSCNTGTGKLEKGEGVISLARGFKYAGCPSIVMTMWPVEDNSSIRLMEYFYRAIARGKSKDEALREAKLKFLDNADPLHAHPYFWAGYILIGDQSALYTPSWIWWAGAGSVVLIVTLLLLIRRRKKKRVRQTF